MIIELTVGGAPRANDWSTWLSGGDRAVFSLLNGALNSTLLDEVMLLASSSWLLPLTVVGLCTYWTLSASQWRHRVLIVAATLLLFGIVDGSGNAVKKAVERTRPCAVVEGARVVSHCPESPSFPSNHAANAFALASFAATYQPALALPVFAIASLVAYSRIHLGVHYPIDVLAGALVGGLVGWGIGTALRRAGKPRTRGSTHLQQSELSLLPPENDG